ncbi:MAG: hypothetical protein MHM6MM_003759 [Cercozoa sp. M6MM]
MSTCENAAIDAMQAFTKALNSLSVLSQHADDNEKKQQCIKQFAEADGRLAELLLVLEQVKHNLQQQRQQEAMQWTSATAASMQPSSVGASADIASSRSRGQEPEKKRRRVRIRKVTRSSKTPAAKS